jgi:hypothetical protein
VPGTPTVSAEAICGTPHITAAAADTTNAVLRAASALGLAPRLAGCRCVHAGRACSGILRTSAPTCRALAGPHRNAGGRSSLPVAWSPTALEPHPCPPLKLAVIERHALAAAGEDHHPGRYQLMPYMGGRAGVPGARCDAGGLGEDVAAAVRSREAPRSRLPGRASLRRTASRCRGVRRRGAGRVWTCSSLSNGCSRQLRQISR